MPVTTLPLSSILIGQGGAVARSQRASITSNGSSVTVHRIPLFCLYLYVGGILTMCSPIPAIAEPLIPAAQWGQEAQLWLARAMVAEAGWTAEDDHAAIAWVLYRRWKRIRVAHPTVTFTAVVRAYCAGLGRQPAFRPRQRWIRTLPAGEITGRLRRYSKEWEVIQQRVEDWAKGEVKDPCQGQAMHWGGHMDHAPRSWRSLDCGSTRNLFYALK